MSPHIFASFPNPLVGFDQDGAPPNQEPWLCHWLQLVTIQFNTNLPKWPHYNEFRDKLLITEILVIHMLVAPTFLVAQLICRCSPDEHIHGKWSKPTKLHKPLQPFISGISSINPLTTSIGITNKVWSQNICHCESERVKKQELLIYEIFPLKIRKDYTPVFIIKQNRLCASENQ